MSEQSPTPGNEVPLPPPSVETSKSGMRTGVKIAIVAACAVVLGIIGVWLFGGDNRDEAMSRALGPALQKNFADQGVTVSITKVDCEKLPSGDGDFSVKCTVAMEGVAETIEATATGSVSGSKVTVDETTSTARLLNETLALQYVQQIVTAQDPSIQVTSCALGAAVIVINPGDTFTCELSTNQTATLTVNENGGASITNVQ